MKKEREADTPFHTMVYRFGRVFGVLHFWERWFSEKTMAMQV